MAQTPEQLITARFAAVAAATQDLWNEVDHLIDEDAISIPEVCTLLGLSRATVYRRLHDWCSKADWPAEPPAPRSYPEPDVSIWTTPVTPQ